MLITARDTLNHFLPVNCGGCGRWDEVVCPRCRSFLYGPLWRCEGQFPALNLADGADEEFQPSGQQALFPVWALGEYGGALRRLIVKWKSGQRPDIEREILWAAQHAGQVLGGCVDLGALEYLYLVPAPSGWRRRLRRALVTPQLAVALAQGLAQCHPHLEITVVDLLRRSEGRAQASLDRARRARQRRSWRCLGSWNPESAGQSAVLLVDDVATTGATLLKSATVLRAAGARICGAFVVAGVKKTEKSENSLSENDEVCPFVD